MGSGMSIDDMLEKLSKRVVVKDAKPYKPKKNKTQYFVYKMYNYKNEPLYIGRTIDVARRVLEHEKDKEWSREISRIDIYLLDSESDMVIYEIYCIANQKPKYNTDYNDLGNTTIKIAEPIFFSIRPHILYNNYKDYIPSVFCEDYGEGPTLKKSINNIIKNHKEPHVSFANFCTDINNQYFHHDRTFFDKTHKISIKFIFEKIGIKNKKIIKDAIKHEYVKKIFKEEGFIIDKGKVVFFKMSDQYNYIPNNVNNV